MIIPGPIFVLLLPVLVAPVVFVLRRFQALAALLAGATALLLAWATYRLPLDGPAMVVRVLVDLGARVSVLDRVLVIEPGDRPELAFAFLVAAALFGFAWRANQGPAFYAFGLVFLSLLSGVLLITPFQYAALLLMLAAAMAAFLIQGGQAGRTRAAQRYLTTAVIALPPILVAGWELEKFVDTPDEVSLLYVSAVLFACTFVVLLSSVPFHAWVPAVGADAPPLVASLLFTVGQSVIVVWLLDLLQGNAQLLRYVDFYRLLSWAGLSMVLAGGLLAFSQVSFGRVMGYAALIDMGALLMALGLGSAAGLQAALLTLLLRACGLVLGSAGLSVLRARASGDGFDTVRGLGWSMPFAAATILLGGLSLAGFPLTPGFVGRWALLRLLAQHDTTYVLVLFLGGVSVAIGYLRGLASLLAPPAPAAEPAPVTPPDATQQAAGADEPVALAPEAAEDAPLAISPARRRLAGLRPPRLRRPLWRAPFEEGIITATMLVIGIAVFLFIALAPQAIMPWVERAAAAYTFFGP